MEREKRVRRGGWSSKKPDPAEPAVTELLSLCRGRVARTGRSAPRRPQRWPAPLRLAPGLCAVALGHSRAGLKSSQNTFICLGIHFMCFELFWGSGRAGTVLLMRKLTVHQSRGETSTKAGGKTKGLRRRITSLMLLLRPKQALCCQAPHLLPLLAGGPHPVPGLQALLLLSGTWSWLPL